VKIDVFGKQFEGIIRVTELKLEGGEETITGHVLHTST
jgi:hypothetical protein